MPYTKRRLHLRTLILVLCTLTVMLMTATSYYANNRVQRQLLVSNSLEANRVYAAKLAAITETFLSNALKQLAYSTQVQGRQLSDVGALQAETERVLQQSNAFNSTFLVDAQGRMLAVSPTSLQHLVGTLVTSPGAQEALRERRPLMSTPFLSSANNLMVVLSQPIHDAAGNYLGFMGGSLYLREHNFLSNLLAGHYYQDGSYLYVIDRNRRLLYHPDAQRIGTLVQSNALVDQLPTQGNGTLRLVNSRGVEMLAGFATVPSTGWGVVAQQPLRATMEPLQHLLLSVIYSSAPLALLAFLLLWWLTLIIVRPLWQLADGAHYLDRVGTSEHLHRVHAWYFEVAELKRALLFVPNLLQERAGRLNRDTQTDPLTGLLNRHGLAFNLSLLKAEGRGFCAIALDADHFKRINDEHGHKVGDTVLRHLAELMRPMCREGDVLCRTGGGEFLMVLPDTSLAMAAEVAERLRRTVQDTVIEPVGAITVSLGVAHWAAHVQQPPNDALTAAKRELQRAKQDGRNQVRCAPSSP